ncbi:MAG: glycoside hydrolase family 1 protein [Myxococcaceae bacterium]
MAHDNELRFPQNFTFGVATAAYQVEGHIENDWSDWERQGKCKNPQHRCGRGVDHWNRFDEDVKLAGDVGCTAFRMSLEWARIEPVRGRFDENAIAEYRSKLQRMKAAGIRPVVTLHHFTHPSWFAKETPWHQPESVAAFRRYAKVCAEIVKGLDAMIVTFNEPMVLLLGGYISGFIPPGIADGGKAMLALGNIGRSHVAAREEILSHCGKTEIGISQNVLVFAPDRAWHPLDRAITRMAADNYNHAFIRALTEGDLRVFMPGLATTKQKIDGAKDSLDFVGINYYTRAHLRFIPKPPFVQFNYRDVHGRGLTHIGWEDYPEGFLQMMLEVNKHHGLPMWITENGIDDRDGNRRPSYLHSHWKQVLTAMKQGVDLRGYLYWSLMDNFEWLDGWGPRFGLYHVDFETLERKKTPACDYFKEVATTKVLSEPGVKFEPPLMKAS